MSIFTEQKKCCTFFFNEDSLVSLPRCVGLFMSSWKVNKVKPLITPRFFLFFPHPHSECTGDTDGEPEQPIV